MQRRGSERAKKRVMVRYGTEKADRTAFTGPWFDYIWDVMLANPEAVTADSY